MISVVIPVYNVEAYLDECLSSVAGQRYPDFECILVDDGSTDGSGGICDRWSSADSRFRVIHQRNAGVSAARNRGIEIAKGEWITFVDSDDWVDADYLESLFQAVAPQVDLVVCGLVRETSDGKSQRFVPERNETIRIGTQYTQQFVDLNRNSLFYGPVVKLYRTDIIRKNMVRFSTGIQFGEDLRFNYHYLDLVDKIACVATCGYHYRIIGQGTLSSKLRADQFATDYGQWQTLRDFYIRHDIWNDVSKALLYQRLWGIVYDGICLYPKLQNPSENYFKEILSIPEIKDLGNWKKVFSCAGWIKFAILQRMSWLFSLYFSLAR